MPQWLIAIPKFLIVSVAIVFSIIFVMILQPPHTHCDSQTEALQKSQERFIFKKSPSGKSKILSLIDVCKMSNSSGGCYEFFLAIKNLLRDLDNVSSDCRQQVGQIVEIKNVLWGSLSLMVQLAWGEKPPQYQSERIGWFDHADVALFCELKKTIQVFYDKTSWQQLREAIITQLPGAKQLSRKQQWEKALLSIRCSQYY